MHIDVKIILAIFIAAFPVSAPFSYAMGDRADTQTEENAIHDKALPSKLCKEDVLVEIGGVRFKVPRKPFSYIDSEGNYHDTTPSSLASGHPYTDCNVKVLKNLKTAGIGPALRDCKQIPNSCETTFSRLHAVWKKAEDSGDVMTLSNGVRKTTIKPELYILPQNIAPTGNGEPVMFTCYGQEKDRDKFVGEICSTRYINVDGLGFGYQFFREKKPEDTYLEIDKAWRSKYNSIKIN